MRATILRLRAERELETSPSRWAEIAQEIERETERACRKAWEDAQKLGRIRQAQGSVQSVYTIPSEAARDS